MKRKERFELLREEVARCQRDADSMRFFGLATRYDSRAIAITETLAELERYRGLLTMYEAALRVGCTDDQLKRIAAACNPRSWMAAWALEMSAALADEEVLR